MTRNEAIEYLHRLYMKANITDEYGDMDDTEPYEEAIDMAVEALSIQTIIKEKCCYCPHCKNCDVNDDLTFFGKWVPCSERLPKERQEILATTTDNAWGDVVIIRTYYKEMHKSVIAWMPLPKPFKENKDEEKIDV